MNSFILLSLFGGALLALVSGPVGSLILWNRWAFLGEALSHAALSGVALAILFQLHPLIGILAVGLFIALFVAYSHKNQELASSTFLAIISHGGLAIGLILFYAQPNTPFNIMNFLIGDILTIQLEEIYMLIGVSGIVIALLFFYWRPILAATVDPDMAKIRGHSVQHAHFILLALMSLLIAFAIKMVGVLLATALFILPASSARYIAISPVSMCIWASLIGILSVAGGILLSLQWDTPTGPLIVVVALCFFIFSSMIKNTSRE